MQKHTRAEMRIAGGGPKYCAKTGKPMYDKKGAITAKNLRWKRDRMFLRPYECDGCSGWHLTKVRNYVDPLVQL